MLRRADRGAERLERALDGGPIPHDPDTRRSLAAAGGLTAGQGRSPARIKATHDAMMTAFMRTLSPVETREDAGTDDGLDEMELHRTEVALPNGGQLVVSDLEEITSDRLDEAAQAAAKILARRAKDHQS